MNDYERDFGERNFLMHMNNYEVMSSAIKNQRQGVNDANLMAKHSGLSGQVKSDFSDKRQKNTVRDYVLAGICLGIAILLIILGGLILWKSKHLTSIWSTI